MQQEKNEQADQVNIYLSPYFLLYCFSFSSNFLLTDFACF